MSAVEIVTLAFAALVLIAWYLTYTAARLHRLHTRAEGAQAALDAQLVRRAEACVELANSAALDPATSLLLAGAATDCLDAAADDMRGLDWAEGDLAQREALESDLSVTMRHALGFLAERGEASGGSGVSGVSGPSGASGVSGPCGAPGVSGSSGASGASGASRAFGASGRAGSTEAPDDAGGRVRDAHRRVQLARRFYNDAVVDVQRLRGNPAVRVFGLAGRAALPRTMEFDDAD